ncbi:glycosyltransferase [bacterium]|nr:glycosyltransferase [bacterium]
MKISVVICTYNPREDYLKRTLDSLSEQVFSNDDWELLLVDNASDSRLSEIWDLSWHPNSRHVREDEPGLTAARLCGIRDSVGELILYVDDDNVLHPHYLDETNRLMSKFPNLGCIGAGKIEPEFEKEPDPELIPYTKMLALREVSLPVWSNKPEDKAVPWGAGLVVRRSVAQTHQEYLGQCKVSRLLDRNGGELNSCGDDDFSWTACRMGMGKGIFPELSLLHLIDERRVQREYLVRIAEGHFFSHAVLRWKHLNKIPTIRERPKAYQVLGFLITGKVSAFFRAGHRYWSNRGISDIELEIAGARYAGLRRAQKLIDSCEHESSGDLN